MTLSTLFEYLGNGCWTEGCDQSPSYFVEKMGEVMSRKRKDDTSKKQALVNEKMMKNNIMLYYMS